MVYLLSEIFLGGTISFHCDECFVLGWDGLANTDILAPSKGWVKLCETVWARVLIGGHAQGFKIHFNQDICHSFNLFNERILLSDERISVIWQVS